MHLDLVVGLGNPGREYESTRHNVGFRVVDELASRRGVRFKRVGDASLARCADGVILVRPETYMNRSGTVVKRLLASGATRPDRMLVVVDDVDLPLGHVRMRRSGGPGTHNGLRDICGTIGRGFPRLRLGVAGEEDPEDLAGYVTSDFHRAEREAVDEMIRRAADAVSCASRRGLEPAMSRYNGPP